MAEIRALIVDDELLARRGIRQLLAGHKDIVVVGECRSGHEALRAIDTLRPDLLFLDVQMPELNGFDVLRERGTDRMPLVVFVTAHDEFAVRAFEAHALDYLLKPLSEARFQATMTRVRERMRMSEAVGLASQLSALLAAADARERKNEPQTYKTDCRLIVPTQKGELLLDVAEIDWIAAEDYYVRIHAGKHSYLLRTALTDLVKRLDPKQFVQVHRSAIVRVDRVRELRSAQGEAIVVLQNGACVPVSRRRREQFATLFRKILR